MTLAIKRKGFVLYISRLVDWVEVASMMLRFPYQQPSGGAPRSLFHPRTAQLSRDRLRKTFTLSFFKFWANPEIYNPSQDPARIDESRLNERLDHMGRAGSYLT
jgi:hypothetical protein